MQKEIEPQPVTGAILPVKRQAERLGDLSGVQIRSGVAAWLGWLFDGLDMHLYTAVAAPFVAQLIGAADSKDPLVGQYSSWIQAAFLVGRALGAGFLDGSATAGPQPGAGADDPDICLLHRLVVLRPDVVASADLPVFGRAGDRRRVGGGGGARSETWPRHWRPWMAAVLQTAVNCGVLLAMLAVLLLSLLELPDRCVFLIGVLPALVVVWIRRAVPETDQWHAAQAHSAVPRIAELFQGSVRRITVLTILVCSFSLTAHWAFMFWYVQHLRNLPDVVSWSDSQKTQLASTALIVVMIASIAGNFLAAALARPLGGYRRAISLLCVAYFLSMLATYSVPRSYQSVMLWLLPLGASSGLFALFTMYMPPLFPTLLRTTGAGFCYNIGRIAAAAGTVVFGLFTTVGDYRVALVYASFLFLPAAAIALLLPEPADETPEAEPVE